MSKTEAGPVAEAYEACAAICEQISEEYQRSEGRKYPELKSDAETGAAKCADAIRAALAAHPTADEGPVERGVRPPLEYATAAALYLAARRGERRFLLYYHDREPKQITGISLGNDCVWVEAGRMLPVHIRADGTSKDGPAIWLEAA